MISYELKTRKQCAEMLKMLRRESGVSQTYLAGQTKISRTQIAMIETGRSFPSIEVAKRIADFFEVAPWSFFYEGN